MITESDKTKSSESENLEALLVKKEVERRQRIAERKELDRLFLEVYHENVRHYPLWAKDKLYKKNIYPGVVGATEEIIKDPKFGNTWVTRFSLNGKKYKIVSRRRGNLFTRDVFYIVELFLNDEKVFAVTEQHDLRMHPKHYYALKISAYANEDWVKDFTEIYRYQEKIDREPKQEPTEESREAVKELKKNFNIRIVGGKIQENNFLIPKPKRFYWQLWVVILLFLALLAAFVVAVVRGVQGLR